MDSATLDADLLGDRGELRARAKGVDARVDLQKDQMMRSHLDALAKPEERLLNPARAV